MGLFEEIQKKSQEYINIGYAVECLALRENSLYKAVMVLLHLKVDEAMPCFKQNEYFDFIDIDNDNDKPSDYSAFEILTDIRKETESNGGIESKILTISDSLKSKISNYYWERELLMSFEPIKKSFEFKTVKMPKSTQKIEPPTAIDLAKLYLYKTPLLTLHEAACIVSDYDPELVDRCRNDTNFSENFSSYLRASRFLDACIGAGDIPYDFNLGIEAHRLKSYLQRENIIIAGFNDQPIEPLHNEPTEAHTELKNTIASLELDLAIEKTNVQKLNKEVDQLKSKIAELENEKMQFHQEKNATNEEKINLTNSDLLLVAALLRMLQNEIKVKANQSQGKVLQKIEDEHKGIKGLSKSRTDKIMAIANNLYKPLINNQMK